MDDPYHDVHSRVQRECKAVWKEYYDWEKCYCADALASLQAQVPADGDNKAYLEYEAILSEDLDGISGSELGTARQNTASSSLTDTGYKTFSPARLSLAVLFMAMTRALFHFFHLPSTTDSSGRTRTVTQTVCPD